MTIKLAIGQNELKNPIKMKSRHPPPLLSELHMLRPGARVAGAGTGERSERAGVLRVLELRCIASVVSGTGW